ncbi:DMT family transporter [Piscinibacter sakaiensis]|uniref:DMT family transporter n=1 Tax=Piscinibacter sakaiensis TaxID=1547922 RepID=UPI003AAD41C3
MKPRDLGELILLAALWGASFLFTRIGAGQFGAVALSGLRVAGAALVLLPILVYRRELSALLLHWKPILILGIVNSALPFLGFSYAVLTISAGLSSIFNSASPLFAALIAWLWLNDRLSASRVAGLLIGFAGVVGLVWSRTGIATEADAGATLLALLACIAAAAAYGLGANWTKRYLSGVPPMAVAAGSQLSATIALAAPTWWFWPAQTPPPMAWLSLAALAVLCTGFAYVIYFRLIAHVGPANAITVTFLIPAFAVAWGAIFLGERVTPAMLLGCLVILSGTALAVGLVKPQQWLRR